jgi:hypothetical protein
MEDRRQLPREIELLFPDHVRGLVSPTALRLYDGNLRFVGPESRSSPTSAAYASHREASPSARA